MIGRLLPLAVSGVILGSAVYLLDGGDADDVDGLAVTGLAALSLVALLLFLGGADLIERISKLGPGGIELAPGTKDAIRKVVDFPAPSGWNASRSIIDIMDEFAEARETTSEQRWAYELGTDLLLHLQHVRWNPEKASKEDMLQYRRFVLRVGQFAIREKDFDKALYILENLKKLEGLQLLPDVTADELLSLGQAYLMVSWKHKKDRPVRHYLDQAKGYLQRARNQDPDDPLVHYWLGFTYDELDLPDLAIREERRTIELKEAYAPWAYWVMAVSYLKKPDPEAALRVLKKIPKGPWWKEICEDDELDALKTDKYAGEFADLCKDEGSTD